MKKIVCITSMNKPYYDKIGKLMIESWSAHWPKDCELLVYQEGFEIEDFDRVHSVSWEDHCYQDWLNLAWSDLFLMYEIISSLDLRKYECLIRYQHY